MCMDVCLVYSYSFAVIVVVVVVSLLSIYTEKRREGEREGGVK